MTADQPQLGPVQSQERIILLDVLRAVAILGMFYSNLGGGFSPPDSWSPDPSGLQVWISDTIFLLVFYKFYPLFAILMGVGMGVQIERADVGGVSIIPIYLRRLLILYLLGVLLLLVLPHVGVLSNLAVVGLTALFLGYTLRHHRFLLLGVILWMFIGYSIPGLKRDLESTPGTPYTVEQLEEQAQRRSDRYVEAVTEATTITSPFHPIEEIVRGTKRLIANRLPRAFEDIGTVATFDMEKLMFMLFGVFLWQIGLFKRSWERRRFFGYLLLFSAVIGLGSVMVSDVLFQRGTLWRYGLADPLTPQLFFIRGFCLDISPWGLDLMYISLVALLLPMKWPGKLLGRLAPAGRMAFTNYVLHWTVSPVLFPLLFAWWLPETGAAENHLKVTGVFILLVIFSTWWLKRFRFGPFEWLWRSLTYWKLQPMRVEASSPTT